MERKKKKNIFEESEDLYEYDEDSDIPVHEKFTKEKKIKKLGLK